MSFWGCGHCGVALNDQEAKAARPDPIIPDGVWDSTRRSVAWCVLCD